MKIELPKDPVILLLEIYSKELETGSQRDIYTLMFMAALFTIAKRSEQPKCLLTDDEKQNGVYYPMEGHSS